MRLLLLFFLLCTESAFSKQAGTQYGLGIGYSARNTASFSHFDSAVVQLFPPISGSAVGTASMDFDPSYILEFRMREFLSNDLGYSLGLGYYSSANLKALRSVVNGTSVTVNSNGPNYDKLQTTDVNMNLFYILEDLMVSIGANYCVHMYQFVPTPSATTERVTPKGGLGYQAAISYIITPRIDLELNVSFHNLELDIYSADSNTITTGNFSKGYLQSASLRLLFWY